MLNLTNHATISLSVWLTYVLHFWSTFPILLYYNRDFVMDSLKWYVHVCDLYMVAKTFVRKFFTVCSFICIVLSRIICLFATALQPSDITNFFEPIFEQAKELRKAYSRFSAQTKIPFITVSYNATFPCNACSWFLYSITIDIIFKITCNTQLFDTPLTCTKTKSALSSLWAL